MIDLATYQNAGQRPYPVQSLWESNGVTPFGLADRSSESALKLSKHNFVILPQFFYDASLKPATCRMQDFTFNRQLGLHQGTILLRLLTSLIFLLPILCKISVRYSTHILTDFSSSQSEDMLPISWYRTTQEQGRSLMRILYYGWGLGIYVLSTIRIACLISM